MKYLISYLTLAIVLCACGQEANDAAPAAVAPAAEAASTPFDYAAAIATTTRLEADYARDAGRMPHKVLEFAGVKPGMTVLDMFSGGGYYTEVIANVVGPDGHVDAHSNEAYLGFVGEEFNARHAEGRLPNVDVLMAENNELALEPGKYDAIMMVQSYHDTYFNSPENGWALIDNPKLLAELYKGLKDDGFVVVVDHAAAPGTSSDSGGTVHRIDPAIVKSEMEAAGFVLDAESNMLRNPSDDYSVNVFDPAVRGKTDRFIMKFRKAG